jgi:hypothetical protein
VKHDGNFMASIHKIKIVFCFTDVIYYGSHKHLRIMHMDVL